jgi:hypothetical protein
MFDRLRRPFPSDPRLEATTETRQGWDRHITVDRAIGTGRTVVTGVAATATMAARAITSLVGATTDDPSPTAARAAAHERQPERSPHLWSGPAAMVVGPSSPSMRAGQRWYQRLLRTDRVVGFPEGWLMVTPQTLMWSPTARRRQRGPDVRTAATGTRRADGAVSVVELGRSDLADVELVAIGRHNAGLTITTRAGAELWLLVDDRKKLDEMLQQLRYGDAP